MERSNGVNIKKIMNKFKIVIPSYNNEKWLEPNLASILNQTYKNYDVLYIDDCSTDDTYETVKHIVADLPNWKVVRNETNMRRGYNLSPYNPLLIDFMEDDEDILLFVDGDDWLYDDYVLEKISKLYDEEKYWMTYGKFVCYPSGDIGNPQNTPYPDEVHKQNTYRRDLWRASHLRTFKWHLYKRIKKEDLIFTQTGEFYFHAEDLATSFPCLEMCPKSKIGVVDFFTYVYNVSQEARARVEDDLSREPQGYKHEVAIRENEVRSRTPYEVLGSGLFITPILAGGLGNMMFQLAASYGIGKRSGHTLLYNSHHVGTLHKHPHEYRETVFRNIIPLEDEVEFYKASIPDFDYKEIILPNENIALDGYFQSYKYFEDCKEDIIQLFTPPQDVVSYIRTKYPNLKNTVALHVRRGDYVNLQEHHHSLSVDYYKNAMLFFPEAKFLVFSDDVSWCKDQFEGDQFTFVEEDDVRSLYLMSFCEHNIIANSTFSWWGAWLNQSPNKIVIYPDKWFGPKNSQFNTRDMFPEDWICLTEECPGIEVNLIDGAFGHLARPNGRYSSVHGKISAKMKFTRDLTYFPGVTIFTDQYLATDVVDKVQSLRKVGWLLETREVNSHSYNTFESYMDKFDFVMTHDAELLKNYPDKTRFTIFGGTWIKTNNYGLYLKTKNVSMIYSDKKHLSGHALRHQVANEVQGIDLFGRGTSRPIEYKEEALTEYRFSVVIENSKAQNYFTEKIVDCFAVGTIPIYWGCPNIGDFFDIRGIIVVNSLEEIKQAVASLNEKEYALRAEAVQNNLRLMRNYAITEDWMYENIFKDFK